MNQLELDQIENPIEQTEVDETDIIGLGFSDIDIIQKIGNTFKFFTTLN